MANKMVQCPACGKEISSKAGQCPSCGHKIKKPIYKKWWFWVVIVLVVAMVAAGSSGGKDGEDKSASVKTGDIGVQASAQTQMETKAPQEPSNIFHVGDVIETDHFSITYQECDTDWRGYNEYMGPHDGMKVVRAYFVFENISDSDHSCGSFDFDCYADGVACDAFIWSSDDSLSYASLSPGRKLQGYIAYEVPVDAQEIELEYETSFWNQEKVIFMVE